MEQLRKFKAQLARQVDGSTNEVTANPGIATTTEDAAIDANGFVESTVVTPISAYDEGLAENG